MDDDDNLINKKIEKLLEMKRIPAKERFVKRGFDIQAEANKLDIFYKRRVKDGYMERT